MAISTCLLEHLLEQHFDNFIGRVEQRVHDDRLFADMVSRCWKFGKSELPERAARFDRLAASGEDVPEDPLTPRELEVIKLIAEGLTSEEIAEALIISHKTVDRHRANILEKLGMRNRVDLTRYAIKRGLVEP